MTSDRDERVRELLDALREDVRAPAELRDAVMREIEAGSPSAIARLVEWVFRPRMVAISPAVGGLALAAVAALILLWPAPSVVDVSTSSTTEGAGRVVTRFVLVAPGASSVTLTGDFVAWRREGIALEDLRGTGIWTGDIALPPGVHQYTFVVNGSEWVPDPSAVLQVDDGFGQLNSIVVVPEEGEA
jgi:hypothetical protein